MDNHNSYDQVNPEPSVRFSWDSEKSTSLKKKRGFSFEEVMLVFTAQTVEGMKNDNPEQWFAIGFLNSVLLTVIYEERKDEEGPYLWLITYWKSTEQEKRLFTQKITNEY